LKDGRIDGGPVAGGPRLVCTVDRDRRIEPVLAP